MTATPQKYGYEENRWPSEVGGEDRYVLVFKTQVLLAPVIEKGGSGASVPMTFTERTTAFSERLKVENYLREHQSEAADWPVMVFDKHARETIE